MKTKYHKTFLFIVFFFCVQLKALVPTVLELPKHEEYYSFYFKKLNKYFDSRFTVNKKEAKELKLNQITHWSEGNGLPQVAWEVEWTHQAISVSLLSPIFRVSPQETLEFSDKFTRNHPNFPLHINGQFIFKEFVTKEVLQRNKQGEVISVYYHLSNVQGQWLPEELRKAVYQIGYDTRLPVDKIKINAKGSVFVYYP
jgi:hypothetical protein